MPVFHHRAKRCGRNLRFGTVRPCAPGIAAVSMSEPSARSASTSRVDTPSRKFNPQTRIDFSSIAFSLWAAYAAFRQKYDSYHATRAFRCNLPCPCSFVQVGQLKSPARRKHHEAIDIPGGRVNRSSSVEHRGHLGSTTGGGVSIIPFE